MITPIILASIAILTLVVVSTHVTIKDLEEELYHHRLLISRMDSELELLNGSARLGAASEVVPLRSPGRGARGARFIASSSPDPRG